MTDISTPELPSAPSTLSGVVIGYSPLIGADRRAIGTRLTIRAHDSCIASGVIEEVSRFIPKCKTPIFLALHNVQYDLLVANSTLPKNAVLEIPGKDFDALEVQDIVRKLHARGIRLAIRGRASRPLADEFLSIFEYSIIHADDELRKKPAAESEYLSMRKIPSVMTDIMSVADIDQAFERGSVASSGWPGDEAPSEDVNELKLPVRTLHRLAKMARDQASHDEIEDAFREDPALAFKLLKHLNSANYGRNLKLGKFKQALLLIGYKNLTKWIEEQISAAPSKDINVYPLMHASLRRGLFLANLAPEGGKLRDTYFMTGAFSLLDRITRISFGRLMGMVSISDDVVSSITTTCGAFSKHLALVQAIEANSSAIVQELIALMNLDQSTVNHALLDALNQAELANS